MLSVGIVFLRFMINDKIKSPDDILKYVGLPTLAIVPRSMDDEKHTAHNDKPTTTSPRNRRKKSTGNKTQANVVRVSHTPASDLRVKQG